MNTSDLIIVSVDDHIVEPPTLFDNQLTKEQRQHAPRPVHTDGVDTWVYEDRVIANMGLAAVAGRRREEYGCDPAAYTQMRKGAWDVDARIEDMNVNGLLGSLNFPTITMFDGSLFWGAKDKAHALTALKAYNNWHIEEWCGKYPGRFIPCGLVPVWSMDETVAEIRRLVSKGCHSITFSDNPAQKGYPSIHNDYWQPLWKVCADNEVVINIHIGTGNTPPHPSMESPIDAWTIVMPMAIAVAAADWLHLKALQTHPKLKVSLSEGGIGWIPYFLERADFTHEHHHKWTNSDFGGLLPSEFFQQHFITCFIDDKFGVENLKSMNEELVCYECDFPHSDTVWPEGPECLGKSLGSISRQQIDKITHLNAMREFKFDPFSVFKREQCTVGALRAQAAHVDTTPIECGGPAPINRGDVRRIVTSGDVIAMYERAGVKKA
jgi:predicted TIM-barrel fold metal-dependent hydrolase